MNADDLALRQQELNDSLQEKIGESLNQEELAALVSAENELSENKDLLNTLNERGVIGTSELALKLNRAFEAFIEKASDIIGAEKCKAIYDFAPGEPIELIEKHKLLKGNFANVKVLASFSLDSSESEAIYLQDVLTTSLVELENVCDDIKHAITAFNPTHSRKAVHCSFGRLNHVTANTIVGIFSYIVPDLSSTKVTFDLNDEHVEISGRADSPDMYRVNDPSNKYQP